MPVSFGVLQCRSETTSSLNRKLELKSRRYYMMTTKADFFGSCFAPTKAKSTTWRRNDRKAVATIGAASDTSALHSALYSTIAGLVQSASILSIGNRQRCAVRYRVLCISWSNCQRAGVRVARSVAADALGNVA